MGRIEANFDGLVGPTHNYAGLSFGNEASTSHAGGVSNPREAALQGLRKMRGMVERGLVQGIIPPHERPAIDLLRTLGFSGDDSRVLNDAYAHSPQLLAKTCSASAMWVANAATVTPSADSADGRLHFTPANLATNFHRGIEPPQTAKALKRIFPEAVHHKPLPQTTVLGDEGAANHMRLTPTHAAPGVEIFVYGTEAFRQSASGPQHYPARQTLEASRLVARNHRLNERAIFVQQSPDAIDAGVFHNDVIAVANENVLFAHERAFVDQPEVLATIQSQVESFVPVLVTDDRITVERAIQTYLFNSQLITLPDTTMWLIAPIECEEDTIVADQLEDIIHDTTNPIAGVTFYDLRESMKNGGGPACLRLRIALTDDELAHVNPACVMNNASLDTLESWVQTHYRDRLVVTDLLDPEFMQETRTALDELTRILNLGALYPFQQST